MHVVMTQDRAAGGGGEDCLHRLHREGAGGGRLEDQQRHPVQAAAPLQQRWVYLVHCEVEQSVESLSNGCWMLAWVKRTPKPNPKCDPYNTLCYNGIEHVNMFLQYMYHEFRQNIYSPVLLVIGSVRQV